MFQFNYNIEHPLSIVKTKEVGMEGPKPIEMRIAGVDYKCNGASLLCLDHHFIMAANTDVVEMASDNGL